MKKQLDDQQKNGLRSDIGSGRNDHVNECQADAFPDKNKISTKFDYYCNEKQDYLFPIGRKLPCYLPLKKDHEMMNLMLPSPSALYCGFPMTDQLSPLSAFPFRHHELASPGSPIGSSTSKSDNRKSSSSQLCAPKSNIWNGKYNERK
ncbi:hypothetical protein KUTeg_024100 [Tegillarca granosa]|uniref:Uncharacterized protein n=1 Tax=Tegillarca granosa TaxID=220873 RepID=A0ABQ9E0J1_TEGGR|nr:hypothetical protein KUTeg_024100 [Tegillarca granosa]